MSDNTVRTAYQGWFNYPNPRSPQVLVAKKGQIDIEHIGTATIAPNAAQIRYRRILSMYGQPPVRPSTRRLRAS